MFATYIIQYYWYEVILHYKAKKEKKKKQFVISAQRGLTLVICIQTRARLEITVHIGQKIRVSAIFVFAYRVKTKEKLHCICRLLYLTVFENVEISIWY